MQFKTGGRKGRKEEDIVVELSKEAAKNMRGRLAEIDLELSEHISIEGEDEGLN
jgi:hypothetical protein